MKFHLTKLQRSRITIELYADQYFTAAAFSYFNVGGGGAPPYLDRRRRRGKIIGGGGVTGGVTYLHNLFKKT